MFIGRDSLSSNSDSDDAERNSFDSRASSGHNDEEEYLVGTSNMDYQQNQSYIQMNRKGKVSRKFMLKATLVTLPDKSVYVEVSENDTVGNLQVIIGENMKTAHTDVFQSLDGVRAFNITKVLNQQLNLKEDFLVSDYLDPDEEVLFEIDSANFWLKLKFQLFN